MAMIANLKFCLIKKILYSLKQTRNVLHLVFYINLWLELIFQTFQLNGNSLFCLILFGNQIFDV